MRTLVIATIFCLALTSVMGADMTKTFKELSKSQFGKAILETMQIQLENKADFRIQINQLLQELYDQTQAAHEQEEAEWNETSTQCAATQARLTTQIEELTRIIKEAKERKAVLEDEIEDFEGQEASLETTLKNLNDQLDAENARRKKEYEDYLAYIAHRDELIAVLKKVKTYISTRLNTRYENPTFLEKKASTEIMNSLAQIKEKVASAEFAARSPGYAKIVSFITTKAQEALSAPNAEQTSYQAADAHADQRFGDIVSVIEQFIQKFQQDKEAANKQEEKNKIRHERTVADLENEIATTKVELENVRLVLNQKRSELSHVNGVIQTSEPQLAQAKAALEAKIKECEQAEKDWNKLNAQRTEEKKLLKEVQEIMAELNDSNIRERTKEVITSL